jgi:hypothetical protein
MVVVSERYRAQGNGVPQRRGPTTAGQHVWVLTTVPASPPPLPQRRVGRLGIEPRTRGSMGEPPWGVR